MSFDFADLRGEYSRLWSSMTIDPANKGLFDSIAKRLYGRIGLYRSVERATRVPATMVAVIHEREADGDLSAYLGNGQPLSMVTTLVPQGRGPFGSFTEGAIDALKYEGLDTVEEWTLERALFELEDYNGPGYRMHHVNSAYLWARTSNYTSGKYVADGVWDPTVKDQQAGCAGIIASLWALDPTLRLPADGQNVMTEAAKEPWDTDGWRLFKDARLAWVQSMLNHIAPAATPLRVDGIDGPFTRAAVTHFQDAQELTKDGIVGPITMARLKAVLAQT